ALQREDGDMRRDDDDHREQRGPADFGGGVDDLVYAVASFELALVGGQAVVHVLDHDHRAVDDDAEVHGAEAEQIGRNAGDGEADESAEQRQRNDQRDDGGGAEVAEEEEEHQTHQHGALDQIREYRLHGLGNQPGAVVERLDADAGRQRGGADFVELGLDRIEHHGSVLALPHQHHAVDDVVALVLAGNALARDAADFHAGHVADRDRRAVARSDDHILDVFRAFQQADAAD